MAEPTNTPIPASTPRATSPAPPLPLLTQPKSPVVPTKLSTATSLSAAQNKPRLLYLGEPIKYEFELFAALATQCEIIRPSPEERQRLAFVEALRERRWGDFEAILQPVWQSGGGEGEGEGEGEVTMERWDEELIGLLPGSVKVFASAGGGGGRWEGLEAKLFEERGIRLCVASDAATAAAGGSDETLRELEVVSLRNVIRAIKPGTLQRFDKS